jgi:hypothetical protein
MAKKPARNVLKLIATAKANKESKSQKAAKAASKKATLASRLIPRRGHR